MSGLTPSGPTPFVTELGMGTDIRGADWTKAATRAVEDALRRNALTIADAFGFPREAMRVRISLGVGSPEAVDRAAIAALLPYGEAEVVVERGGLAIPDNAGTGQVILANAALTVSFDLAHR